MNKNKNINKELNSEWYLDLQKKKNIRKEEYYADACDLSRNHNLTKKSQNNKKKIQNNKKKIQNNKKKIQNDFLPLSGSETHYHPKKWNSNFDDKLNHNCYAYVLNDFREGRSKRPQPGHRDPYLNIFRKQDYTREEITRRAIYDNPSIYCTAPESTCSKGYYKGALVIDRYNNYHWLVQNSNGYWSHKPGQLDVTNTDADKKLIKDPRTANLIYDKDRKNFSLIYSDIGPFFCIPNPEETGIKIVSETCEQCGGSNKI